MVLDYKKNLSNIDRIIRATIGLYTLWLVYTGVATGWWAVAAFAFAVFQFIEAALAY